MRLFLLAISCTLLVSCGEDFWAEDLGNRPQFEQDGREQQMVATLQALDPALSNLTGHMTLSMRQEMVNMTVQFNSMPATLSLAHHQFTSENCEQLAGSGFSGLNQFNVKSASRVESGTTSAIFTGANNEILPQVEGQRLVIYAVSAGTDNSTFPLACGQVVRVQTEEAVPLPNQGGVAAAGGVAGGVDGTVGGNIGGGVAGGVAGNVTGGFTGGTNAGNVVGGFQSGINAGAGGLTGGLNAGTPAGIAAGIGVAAGSFGGADGGGTGTAAGFVQPGRGGGAFQGGAGTAGVAGGFPAGTPNVTGGTPGAGNTTGGIPAF